MLLLALSAAAESREQDYIRQDSARFRIVYCPEDAGNVRVLWDVFRRDVPLVETRLGLTIADTISFIITPDEREWGRVTAGAPLWANGIAFPERGVAVLKSPRFGLPYGPLGSTAIHEYVHLLLHTGATGAEFPRWLDEGLAQLLAGQVWYRDDAALGRAVTWDRLHSLRQIERLMSMRDDEARQGYAESAVAVQLLESRFGMAGLSNLVHALRQGNRYEDAFSTIFGMPPGQFDSEYQDYVRSAYRFSILTDTEVWISALFVILVLGAGLATWKRRKRVKERWTEEDRTRREASGEPEPPPYKIDYTLVRGRMHDRSETGSEPEEPPHDRPMPGN